MRPFASIWLALALVPPVSADDPAPPTRVPIDRITIDDNFPDAYQVEVADVDGDGKPDLVALGGATIAWYQNPTWTKRIIATGGDPLKGDIISSATTDLDGDGKAEVAIACDFAMNTPTRGQLWLASQGDTLDAPWTLRKVTDVPSIHRVRWADIDDDKKLDLVVAPIFGPKAKPPTFDQDPARVVWFRPDGTDPKGGPWVLHPITERLVVHAVQVGPGKHLGQRGKRPVMVAMADNTGVSVAQLVPDDASGETARWSTQNLLAGAPGLAPRRGSSDFNGGTNRKGVFFVTIDPWHGSELAVWQLPELKTPPVVGRNPEAAAKRVAEVVKVFGMFAAGRVFARTVIDNSLDDGHALWVADVDGDGADEIFAGHRGKDHRVAMYRFNGTTWDRTVIDTAIAAQDLRGGDLDGDGVPDIVAAGGKTHNVVWYRPSRLAQPEPAGAAR